MWVRQWEGWQPIYEMEKKCSKPPTRFVIMGCWIIGMNTLEYHNIKWNMMMNSGEMLQNDKDIQIPYQVRPPSVKWTLVQIQPIDTIVIYRLVAEPPLWKILVSWENYSQYMGKYKMFQTTNQYELYVF